MSWSLPTAFAAALPFLVLACGTVAPTPAPGGNGAAAGQGATGGAAGGGGSGAGGGSGGSSGSIGVGGSGNAGGAAGGGAQAGQSQGGFGGQAPPVGGELSDCSTPGPRLIRRLTSIQLRNTLVDAFQDQSVPSADVLTDPSVLRFRVDADAAVVRDLDAALLIDYAEKVAEWAVPSKLSLFTSCTTNDASCQRELIQNLGTKLYREPLLDARVGDYLALFAAEQSFEDGAKVVIATLIQSPYLLYRRELGAPDPNEPGRWALTPYEVASELSYFLLDTAPDATLLAAAAANALGTAEAIDQQAARLLNTPAAKLPVARFASGWLELDGLPTKAKDDATFALTPELRASMQGEASEFFASTFAAGADVTTLLTADYTYVDAALAAFYGLAAGGAGFQRVELAGTQRAPGLLGQAGFLTAHAQPENSSPTQRGRFVRERLLCDPIPAMPTDLDTNLASGAGFTTNRERYTEHTRNPVCAGCHTMFDPTGFAFEHYDGFGRYRDQENGVTIDATGLLTEGPTGDVPLDGLPSLVSYLASEDRVRACLVRFWSYYAHGRDNWTEKKCNDDAVRRDAAAHGYSLYSIVTGILHAPTFSQRVVDP